MHAIRSLPHPLHLFLIPPLCALMALAAAAQAPMPIAGILTTAGGKPIPGASVFTGTGVPPDGARTDSVGHFQLTSSSSVLHIQGDGFQPLTLILDPPATDLRVQLHPIALSPLSGAVLIPRCTPIRRKDRLVRRIGAPQSRLRFTVPRHGWRVSELGGVNLDDFIVQRRHSRNQLNLWFGVDALRPLPEDRFFVQSASFAQRAILPAAGPAHARSLGIDSYGTFFDGTAWRQLAIRGAGATYDRVSPQDARLFDSIIDSLCIRPPSPASPAASGRP